MTSQFIDNEIDRFRAARDKLMNAIAPCTKDAAERVIAFAHEFGVNATLQGVMKANNPMGVTVPRGNAQALAQILGYIVALLDRLDLLVAERNEQAAASDPGHRRVFMHFDRAFTIDLPKGIIIYLDDPSNPRPIQLSVVHTKDQPGPQALRLVQQERMVDDLLVPAGAVPHTRQS